MDAPPDRIDRQILTLLQNNARLSNKELAGKIGLAPSTCHTRVQRLLEVGAIRGFHAEVDPRALGVNIQALLMLRLTHHSKADWDAIVDHLSALDEVVDVFHIAGTEDLLLRVAAADTDEEGRFAFAGLPAGRPFDLVVEADMMARIVDA